MNNVKFYIYGMKEPDYILLFMKTYEMLTRLGEEQQWTVQDGITNWKIRFKYPEVW